MSKAQKTGVGGFGFWAFVIVFVSRFGCPGQGGFVEATKASAVEEAVRGHRQAGKCSLQRLEPMREAGDLKFCLLLAGRPHVVVLQKHSLRAPGFRVVMQEGAGAFHEVPAPEPGTYRGYVEGCGGSTVCASISEGRIRAILSLGDTQEETWMIEPVQSVLADAPAGQHLVYTSQDTLGETGVCGNRESPTGTPPRPESLYDRAKILDVLVCRIACDADYEYYVSNGSSVSNTVTDIEAIINGVSAIFERDTGVAFSLTQIMVRSAEPDPYSATTVDGLLSQFRLEWNNNCQDVPRDVAHLFTGKSFGTVLGNSYTDQVCPGFNHYSLVRSRWQTDLGKRIALSAHELGHSFDAVHCDYDADPRCRIMCSNLGGCSNGYHSFEDSNAARIRATAASAACLTPGTMTTPRTALPFADNFNSITYPPQAPNPAKWTGADLAQCQYQHLEISIGRDFNFNQKLGTVRTLPMQLNSAARVQYKLNPNSIPPSQSLKIDYFNSSSLTWQNLRTIHSDGSTQYRSYEDTVPADGAGNYFAVRFSAYATTYTAAYAWNVDDVSISEIASPPQLAIAPTPTNTVVISWPLTESGWELEAAAALDAGGGDWTLIAPPYTTNEAQCVVVEPASLDGRFYRLRTP